MESSKLLRFRCRRSMPGACNHPFDSQGERMSKLIQYAVVLLFSLTTLLYGEPPEKEDSSKPEFKAEFPKEAVSETKHTVQIDGKSVSYTATAGNIVLKEENGRPKASI